VAQLPLFNGEEKVVGFVIVCKLYLRMRMRDKKIEEQMQ